MVHRHAALAVLVREPHGGMRAVRAAEAHRLRLAAAVQGEAGQPARVPRELEQQTERRRLGRPDGLALAGLEVTVAGLTRLASAREALVADGHGLGPPEVVDLGVDPLRDLGVVHLGRAELVEDSAPLRPGLAGPGADGLVGLAGEGLVVGGERQVLATQDLGAGRGVRLAGLAHPRTDELLEVLVLRHGRDPFEHRSPLPPRQGGGDPDQRGSLLGRYALLCLPVGPGRGGTEEVGRRASPERIIASLWR